jgi:hypothetical protein
MTDSSEEKIENPVFADPYLRYLLNILKEDLANNGPSDGSTAGLDFSEIITLSGRHGIIYFLYSYLQKRPNLLLPGQVSLLRERLTRKSIRSLRQLQELVTICEDFNERGLKYAIVKGPHLARMLYGNEAVKVSADLDILMVHQSDLPTFHSVLTKLGYSCPVPLSEPLSWKQRLFLTAKREVNYFSADRKGVVDLHIKPVANSFITAGRYRAFFAETEQVRFEGINIYVLPVEKYLVYLCYHAACHQFSRLAWLVDIRNFYRQQQESMDMEKMLQIALFFDGGKSLSLAFSLLHLLFAVEIPRQLKPVMEHFKGLPQLARNCLRVMAYKKDDDLKITSRIERILFLLRMSGGIFRKADVLIGVVVRKMVDINESVKR